MIFTWPAGLMLALKWLNGPSPSLNLTWVRFLPQLYTDGRYFFPMSPIVVTNLVDFTCLYTPTCDVSHFDLSQVAASSSLATSSVQIDQSVAQIARRSQNLFLPMAGTHDATCHTVVIDP